MPPLGLVARQEASRGREGARQDVAKLRRQDVASSPGQDVAMGEAGCHLKMRQDVAAHRFAHHKTACLLTLSPLACHEAACSEPVKRRFNAWSGRRDSNPRQPAWKAGTLPFSFTFLYPCDLSPLVETPCVLFGSGQAYLSASDHRG